MIFFQLVCNLALYFLIQKTSIRNSISILFTYSEGRCLAWKINKTEEDAPSVTLTIELDFLMLQVQPSTLYRGSKLLARADRVLVSLAWLVLVQWLKPGVDWENWAQHCKHSKQILKAVCCYWNGRRMGKWSFGCEISLRKLTKMLVAT